MSLRLSDYYPLGSPNIVYTVGDQIISGVKNFYDRPRYLNTGLVSFGDFTELDFLLTGNVSGIFDSFVLSDNLFFVSQASGQITGDNRTGYYDGGNFLGRTKLTQNNTKLINIGNNWVSSESARLWDDISISSDGKYVTAIVLNGRIYISNNYGETWEAREQNRNWHSVRMSSDGKYQIASTENGNLYVSNDYGNIWVSKGPSTSWNYVDISSNGQYQIAAGAGAGNFIYISSNYGDTWVQNTSSRNLNLVGQWVSVAISSDGRYITAVGAAGKIYISKDYGETWLEKNITETYVDVAMSSNGQFQTVATLGAGIYISKDYGNTWKLTSNRAINKVRMSSCGKYQIFISNNNNIHLSETYGETWVEKTPLQSQTSIQWNGIAISSDAKYIFAAASSNLIYLSKADELIDGNIYAQNLVYNTANQTISGIKNFSNRLTINNTGVLLSGESLTKETFEINSGIFKQDYRFLQKITGDGEFANYTAAVFNDSGNILVLGGRYAGVNDNGAILIYTENKNNGWEIKQKLTGSRPNQGFGLGVAINNDASVIAVRTSSSVPDSITGSVSIYTGNSNSEWVLKQPPILDGSINDLLSAVSISKDNSVIAMSNTFDFSLPVPNDGSARLYTGNPVNGWNFRQKLSVPGADLYGNQTYLNSNGTICILTSRNDDDGGNNAGGAAIFTGNPVNGWNFKEKILGVPSPVGTQIGTNFGPRFGNSLAASEDASIIALGGPSYNSPLVSSSDNSVGAVLIFTGNSNNGWILRQRITGFNSGQGFGGSLVMNGDGSILLIGAGLDDSSARNAGIAYAYTGNSANGWNLSKTFLGDLNEAYKAANVAPLYGTSLGAGAINKSGNLFFLRSNFEVQSNGIGLGGGIIYTTDESNFKIGYPENLEFLSISGSVKIDGNLSLSRRPTVNGVGVLLQGEAAGSNVSIENVVYATGNQTISGVKNFNSRPTVSGSGVLLQGEIINTLFNGDRQITQIPVLNTNYKGTTINEFLENMFFPYVQGSVTLSLFSIKRYGIDSVINDVFAGTITTNSDIITGIAYLSGTNIQLGPLSRTVGGNYSSFPPLTVNIGGTVSGSTNENYRTRIYVTRSGVPTTIDSLAQRIRFEPVYYWGVSNNPNLTDLSLLTRVDPVSNANFYNYSYGSRPASITHGFTPNGQYIYLVYPSFARDGMVDWGTVTQIRDIGNNLTYTLNTYQTGQLTVNLTHQTGMRYRVYRSVDLITPIDPLNPPTYNMQFTLGGTT